MARGSPTGSPRARPRGYAYVMLLVALAVLSGAAASSVSLGAAAGRREAELHLLVIGEEFRDALRSYRGLAPGQPDVMGGPGPRALEDLLRDPRAPGLRRHLRQLRADPLTGRREWGLVLDSTGVIVGVHSLADGQPIKQGHFPQAFTSFEGARSYREWVFGSADLPVRPQEVPAGRQTL